MCDFINVNVGFQIQLFFPFILNSSRKEMPIEGTGLWIYFMSHGNF